MKTTERLRMRHACEKIKQFYVNMTKKQVIAIEVQIRQLTTMSVCCGVLSSGAENKMRTHNLIDNQHSLASQIIDNGLWSIGGEV